MISYRRYLYDILTKATVVKKRVPVLIFCNKTDKVTAHSKEFIKKQLEKEVYVLFFIYDIFGLLETMNALLGCHIVNYVKLPQFTAS
jgi:signal recognition particle receptor subunit beta